MFGKHISRLQLFGVSQHHRILLRIDFQDVGRFAQGYFESLALPDGVIGKAFVFTQLNAFRIDKPSRSHLAVYLRRVFAQEITVITFNEADLHALAFFRLDGITFVAEVFADLLLGIGA